MARAWQCRASSQAIMCVQLLSWCAAACLLLYRGVTTLRRDPPRPPPSNFSWFANDSDYSNETNNELSSDNEMPVLNGSGNGLSSIGSSSFPHLNVLPTPMKGSNRFENDLSSASRTESRREFNGSVPREVLSAGVPGIGAGGGVSTFARLRRELRPASLILIVLGFSMLLVGPVVVVLRKCDSTLSHRRASKVPTEDEEASDPPPSYDEATRGTGPLALAPRYSSLFEVRDSGELVLLNAPSSPSPTRCLLHKAEIVPACRRA